MFPVGAWTGGPKPKRTLKRSRLQELLQNNQDVATTLGPTRKRSEDPERMRPEFVGPFLFIIAPNRMLSSRACAMATSARQETSLMPSHHSDQNRKNKT